MNVTISLQDHCVTLSFQGQDHASVFDLSQASALKAWEDLGAVLLQNIPDLYQGRTLPIHLELIPPD